MVDRKSFKLLQDCNLRKSTLIKTLKSINRWIECGHCENILEVHDRGIWCSYCDTYVLRFDFPIVHKVYLRNGDGITTKCEIRAKNGSNRWADVTCNGCLKKVGK